MIKKILLLLAFLPCLLAAQVQVFNAGIGGHNTRHGLKRIDQLLLQYKPTVLVVGYGANDCLNSKALVAEKEFTVNLAKIIASARKNGVRTIVLNACNPCIDSFLAERHKYTDNISPTERVKKYNKLVAETAAQQKVIFNDFHAAMMKKGGATVKRTSLVRNVANSKVKDGLHLTADGAKLLAETVAEALNGKVKKNDRILCLGDSITFGVALTGAGTVTGQTYPAWLKTILNHKLGLSKNTIPPPYIKPRPMQIPNPDFAADQAGVMPLEWVASPKTCSIVTVNEGKNKFLRITANGISFCRTNGIIPQSGKWILHFRAKGKGRFNIGVTMTGLKPAFVQLHKDWRILNDTWQDHQISFEVPPKAKMIMLVLRTKDGVADFDDFAFIPAPGSKMAAAAQLKIKNAEIAFLHPRQGGGIISLVKDGKTEFINLAPRKSIWAMTLKKIDTSHIKLPEVAPLSIDPERDDNGGGKNNNDISDVDLKISALDFTKAKTEFKADAKSVVMTWKGLNIGKEKGVLDVKLEIKTAADGKSFIFNGSFNNRSKEYTVFYFDYPVLGGIGGINGRFQQDFLATPFFNGRLIQNPVEKGLFKKNRIYQPNRSGHSLHMDVFYNGQNGLYLGVHDPDQNAKRWDLSADRVNGFSWFVRNIPNNMRRVPQQWQIPYPTVLQFFNGDWYDGAQIYRSWAINQYWCREGKIHVRKSIPQWFKDTVEWGQYVAKKFESQDPLMRRFRKDFPEFPLAVFLSYWGRNNQFFHGGDPDHFPLGELDWKVIRSLKENNVSIMGYIQATSWSDFSPSFKKDVALSKRNLVRNYYGQFIKWNYQREEQCLIAYPGEVWAKALGDTVVKMAEAGFRTAYMDSGNHGGTYLNFTPDCSSDSGGGNGYIKGQQKLLETIRKRARAVNPEFCFTSESFWEGNIAHLDGYLVCNTTNAYLENDRVIAIPLIQTVYKDYALMHSVWPSRYDVERDNALGYVAKNGLALCWGVTPGWNIFNLLYKYKNGDIALKTSRLRYEAYVAGKKYFIHGQLLRQPVIHSDAAPLRVKWHRSYSASYHDILMDPVIGTVFRAPDGSYGLILYNISEKSLKIKADLRKSLPKGNFTAKALYPAKQQFLQKNQVEIELDVPARLPVIITLTKQN